MDSPFWPVRGKNTAHITMGHPISISTAPRPKPLRPTNPLHSTRFLLAAKALEADKAAVPPATAVGHGRRRRRLRLRSGSVPSTLQARRRIQRIGPLLLGAVPGQAVGAGAGAGEARRGRAVLVLVRERRGGG